MHDRWWIVAGLAAFVALITAPFWAAATAAKTGTAAPKLTLPANQRECVAPAAYMRRSHMQLLIHWREDVVRRNDRQYVAYNGRIFDKSLTRTCLGCHSKAEFCDRCHTYSGVSAPSCWSCHNEPQSAVARRSMP